MESATANARGGGSRFLLFVLLFAIAIPWYWDLVGLPRDARTWGMPTWFVVAVLGSLAISIVVAWQLRRPWPEDESVRKDKSEL